MVDFQSSYVSSPWPPCLVSTFLQVETLLQAFSGLDRVRARHKAGRFFCFVFAGGNFSNPEILFNGNLYYNPVPSMGRTVTYLHDWLIFMVNVCKCGVYSSKNLTHRAPWKIPKGRKNQRFMFRNFFRIVGVSLGKFGVSSQGVWDNSLNNGIFFWWKPLLQQFTILRHYTAFFMNNSICSRGCGGIL